MSENPTGTTRTFGPSGTAKSPQLNYEADTSALAATREEDHEPEVVAKVVEAEDKPRAKRTTAATKDA